MEGRCDKVSLECKIKAWCPLENKASVTLFANAGSFTVYAKNHIRIPALKVSRSNTIDKNGDGSPIFGYNLFTLDSILSAATKNDKYHRHIDSYADIASTGAIVLATAEWDCDLDRSLKHCNPKWKFLRSVGWFFFSGFLFLYLCVCFVCVSGILWSLCLNRVDNTTHSISAGYNFRTVSYSIDGSMRTLRKLYGVRVVFATAGQGSKFDFATLTVTLGAGMCWILYVHTYIQYYTYAVHMRICARTYVFCGLGVMRCDIYLQW